MQSSMKYLTQDTSGNSEEGVVVVGVDLRGHIL